MQDTATQYYQMMHRQTRTTVIMLLVLAATIFIALNVGPIKLSLPAIFSQADAMALQVLLSIRLPRILATIIAGASLSICGLSMQNVLRNPLASPFTLGISGAAAFGAAFSIVVIGAGKWFAASSSPLLAVAGQFFTGITAFMFSMLSIAVIMLVMKQRGSRPTVIILAGIMTSSLFSACTSALQYFADDRQLAEIIFWTFGDPGRAGYPLLLLQAIIVLPAIWWMVRHRWDFSLLQSGDDSARSCGMNPSRFRLHVLLLTSLVTSIIVAGYGIISFVGLIAPHLCRFFFKDQSLPIATALFGAILLLFSDTLARFILQPIILPIGIVTAFFGAPFFIFMLINKKGL